MASKPLLHSYNLIQPHVDGLDGAWPVDWLTFLMHANSLSRQLLEGDFVQAFASMKKKISCI